MREIKFRAWDQVNNIMFNVFGFDVNHVYPFLNHNSNLMPTIDREECILMQYTGSKDKNGVEIYEGDVLLDINRKDIYYVEYFTQDHNPINLSGFYAKLMKTHKPMIHMHTTTYNFEVIGNIYENSSLIEKQNVSE